MRDLYLVRHGEATGGPSGMDRDFFLTEAGEEQADATGRRLNAIGVAPVRIYASRLTRARRTAEIIARHVPAAVELRDDLIEHGSQALLLDCSKEEAAALHPDKLRPDGSLTRSPGDRDGLNWNVAIGGETLCALHDRARSAFESIIAAHPGPDQCIVVAHGSFLAAMVTEILGLPLRPVWNVQLANAAFVHLRLYDGDGGPHPVIIQHGPGDEAETFTRSEQISDEE